MFYYIVHNEHLQDIMSCNQIEKAQLSSVYLQLNVYILGLWLTKKQLIDLNAV